MVLQTNVSRCHAIGRMTVFAVVAILVCTIALQWSWNTVAYELFKMPTIQFKHALGFELFTCVVVLIWGMAVRLFLSCPQCLTKRGCS